MATKNNCMGMDRELQKKMKAKFDPAKAAEAAAWIAELSGMEVDGNDLVGTLKSGQALCKALNAIKPGSVRKINSKAMPFVQRENILNYLNGCKALGMKEIDNFVTQDLYEGDNLVLVYNQIFTLSALSRRVAGFDGPFIGTSVLAQENKRQFTTEQLAKSKGAVPILNQGSKHVDRTVHTDHIIAYANVKQPIHSVSNAPSQQNMGSVQHDLGTKTDKIVLYANVKEAMVHSDTPSQQTAGSVQTDLGKRLDQIVREPIIN